MNYVKYAQDNQKKLGYKIIEINGSIITIECSVCGAIRKMQLKSLYRKNEEIHNQFCRKYCLDICKKEVGKECARMFHDFYRRSHERCCNPNCKDYERYKGKFKFRDFCDFYKNCFDEYKFALKKYNANELTIDRIDSLKGYEKGNIRFVPMIENLQNKPNVKRVKMTHIYSRKVITGKSFGDLARKYKDVSYASTLYNACKENRLYKKKWKIEYIET